MVQDKRKQLGEELAFIDGKEHVLSFGERPFLYADAGVVGDLKTGSLCCMGLFVFSLGLQDVVDDTRLEEHGGWYVGLFSAAWDDLMSGLDDDTGGTFGLHS